MSAATNRTVVVGAAAAILLIAAPPALGGWDQYRGDPERTGSERLDGSLPEGKTDWRVPLGNRAALDQSPVVDGNGIVYLGTSPDPDAPGGTIGGQGGRDFGEDAAGRLIAVFPNGRVRWRIPLFGFAVRATPAARPDGRLVVVGSRLRDDGNGIYDEERVFMIESASGQVLQGLIPERGATRTSPALDRRNNSYVQQARSSRSQIIRYDTVLQGEPVAGVTYPLTGSSPIIEGIKDFIDRCFPLCKFDPKGSVRPRFGAVYPSAAYSTRCNDVVGVGYNNAIDRGYRWWPNARKGWEKDLISPVTPTIGKGGRLYVAKDHRLWNYDQGGSFVWRTRRDSGRPIVSPVALGRNVPKPPRDNRTRERGEEPDECTSLTRDASGAITRRTVRDGRTGEGGIYVSRYHSKSGRGQIEAYTSAGEFVWRRTLGDEPPGDPVVVRDRKGRELIVVTSGARVWALGTDSRSVWQRSLDDPSYGSPAVAQGRIYIATRSSLYAFR